jgi:hypothetical protein
MHGKGQVKLTSWLGAALCDQPANYPESTRRTHIGRVLEFVHELVNGDEGRERYLVAAAQQKLALDCERDVDIRRAKVQAVERLAADGVEQVLSLVQSENGRTNNHNRVVREILLTAIRYKR